MRTSIIWRSYLPREAEKGLPVQAAEGKDEPQLYAGAEQRSDEDHRRKCASRKICYEDSPLLRDFGRNGRPAPNASTSRFRMWPSAYFRQGVPLLPARDWLRFYATVFRSALCAGWRRHPPERHAVGDGPAAARHRRHPLVHRLSGPDLSPSLPRQKWKRRSCGERAHGGGSTTGPAPRCDPCTVRPAGIGFFPAAA